jgi:hypothetical protein
MGQTCELRPNTKIGDHAWLEEKNSTIRTSQLSKLAPRRHGPFRVTQVMSAVNYCLELPTQWSIHPVSSHRSPHALQRNNTIHGANYHLPTTGSSRRRRRVRGPEGPRLTAIWHEMAQLAIPGQMEGVSGRGQPVGRQRRRIHGR